jgi:PAS domain S-box-containing protein
VEDDALFRGVVDAVPDAVVVVDDDGTIVLANAQCRATFGREPADLVGAQVALLVADGLPEPGPAAPPRLTARRADGTEFPAEVSLAPLRANGAAYVAVTVRDITDQRRLEADSQRVRDELLATVSHELRTPLTSIIGYTELMADLGDSDLSRRARKLLGVIERNAERELRLVDDLLTMAYLDDHRLRIDRRPVDLGAVARRVVDDASLRARERGLTLRLVAAELAPVHADFYRLVQVLENLLANALKFTGPGGRVDVVVRDDGAMGVVEVCDTGIGVSPEEKERVFERLYRAPSAIRNQAQGAGLGLPIVRAIVEAHGGTVQVESEVGVGTTVRVAIPHAAPADPVSAG